MDEFGNLLAQTMDLAAGFAPTTNDAMRARKANLKQLALLAVKWVHEWQPEAAEHLRLSAEDGGQVGAVSPIGWMRVFSLPKSPSATEGFYVVYLLDATGDRVFLSLNQGTSEYRRGTWRTISDFQKVVDRTAAARFALEEAGADLAWGSADPFDLRAAELRDQGRFKSVDPVRRARAYELGSIVAKSYDRASIPSDEVLRRDLLHSVESLVLLYTGEDAAGASFANAGASAADDGERLCVLRRGPRGLGRLSGPERRAVESRSMDVTRQHYEASDWVVVDVSASRPYDFECRKGDRVLHVEVKGTTASEFAQIELTMNEVDHCRHYPDMELALVSAIRLTTGDDSITATGGELSFVIPWAIEEGCLVPFSFLYRLPADRAVG